MVQDVVVGTLATLNLLVSPLSPGVLSRQTSHFALEPNARLEANCRPKDHSAPGELSLNVESVASDSFTLVATAKICDREQGSRNLTMTLNLPIQLLDESFLENLKPNQSYVLAGIPSSTHPGKKERLKITRLPSQGDLEPIEVEWIPQTGFESEVRPLTVWIDQASTPAVLTARNPSSSSSNPPTGTSSSGTTSSGAPSSGSSSASSRSAANSVSSSSNSVSSMTSVPSPPLTPAALPWKKVRLSYKEPLATRALVLTGQLKSIESEN